MIQQYLKNGLLLTVREARPEDAEKVLKYAEQVASETENITRGPGELDMTPVQERELLQEYLQAPGSLFLVAEIAGEIVGDLNFQAGKRQRTCHIGEMGIAVLRHAWNLGIGSLLMNTLIEWARTGGVVRKIDLLVRVDNFPAIHLYEKYGFVREGRIARGLRIRNEFIDLYTMGLLIDPA